MPYDKNGKYYRQPVYNKNFISNGTAKYNSEKSSSNKNISPDSATFPIGGIIYIVFMVILLGFLINNTQTVKEKNYEKVFPTSKDIKGNNERAPSIEKTLDNMLKYQKEKDAKRFQEKIIENYLFKEMNSW